MISYEEEEKLIIEKVKGMKLKRVNEKLEGTLLDNFGTIKEDVLYMYDLVVKNINHLNRDSDIEVLNYSPLSTSEIKVAKVRSYYEEGSDGDIKYGIFFIDRKTNKLLNKFGVIYWKYEEDYDGYSLSEVEYYKFR